MSSNPQHPWASGPGEILRHGLELLKNDSDTNRRLAMICIDNEVELMTKTYLGLPKRITGISISRKEFGEISESFPAILDALEKYAAAKLDGIDLGTIEWYHRLRNELYHQGNGLTVERDKVVVYAELANVLFKNLFGFALIEHVTSKADLLGDFIHAWGTLERRMAETASRHSLLGTEPRTLLDSARFLDGAGILDTAQVNEINLLRQLRNDILHGKADYRATLTHAHVKRVKELADSFPEEQ